MPTNPDFLCYNIYCVKVNEDRYPSRRQKDCTPLSEPHAPLLTATFPLVLLIFSRFLSTVTITVLHLGVYLTVFEMRFSNIISRVVLSAPIPRKKNEAAATAAALSYCISDIVGELLPVVAVACGIACDDDHIIRSDRAVSVHIGNIFVIKRPVVAVACCITCNDDRIL